MTDSIDTPPDILADTAVQAVLVGGAVLLEHWSRDRHIQFKGDIDLVTDADRSSEAAVVSLLRNRFPDHRILAEEGSDGGNSPLYRWIVDPLDGTTNYAHGYPHFAVSVALERAGIVVVGAVYDPFLNELFTATHGGGAYLNRSRLWVSSQDRLLASLLATGFPYDRMFLDDSLRRWEHFARRSQAIRRDGSAALDICYVAAGRLEGFFEEKLHPWDAAAGALIVREAGGTVTDFLGRELDLFRGEVVASNGVLHRELLAGIANARLSASTRE